MLQNQVATGSAPCALPLPIGDTRLDITRPEKIKVKTPQNTAYEDQSGLEILGLKSRSGTVTAHK